MLKYFGADGALSKVLDGYEVRDGQERMADAVHETLNSSGSLLVEAGTGTGKTLAYLIPAVLSGKKVVISTGTKNLQEQLAEKDIPIVEKIFNSNGRTGAEKFKAAVMKGRGNYICRRRFRAFSQQPLFTDSNQAKHFIDIQKWANETKTGDRAEIAGLPDDYAAWREINSRSDLCLGQACPTYDTCFITTMRSEAAVADLIVVNHHLFFADLSVKQGGFGEVIPRYDAVIFDEAHQIESVASDYFGRAVSTYKVTDALVDTRRELGAAKQLNGDTIKVLDALQRRSTKFFDLVRGNHGDGRRRLKRPDMNALGVESEGFIIGLEMVADHLLSMNKGPETITALAARYRDMADLLREITSFDKDDHVYWAEVRGRGVFLQTTPIDVSDHLIEKLYPSAESFIFTSATLSVNENFKFTRSRLGLNEVTELLIDSPFDYKSQATLYIASDLPEPASEMFADRASGRIEKLLKLTDGRAFLLFTSYRMMDRLYDSLEETLPYTLLKQGEAPRSELLERFREDNHSVLFGAASFWQGVDVKGESLSAVVIDRLPFASPGDPVVEARIESINKNGGSAFNQYQLPMAVLALKQGMGRLIRGGDDKGLLAILDRRILSKSYGKIFIKSLPSMEVVTELDQLITPRLLKIFNSASVT